jgi:hypothetical protein
VEDKDLEALARRWSEGVRAESILDGWLIELLVDDWLRGGALFEGGTLTEAVNAAWRYIERADFS